MDSENSLNINSRKDAVIQGVIKALPIVVGYVPIGFAFGVLARKVGISSINTLLMSVVVFAGSSQFIAVGLVLAGATALSIIITTFIVNLRHMLMAAALSPYLKKWRTTVLSLFAFQLTDETFAIHANRFSEKEIGKLTTITINMIAQISWVLGTMLGIIANDFISDVEPFGLDYALIAMFIGLLVFQLKTKTGYIVAILSGVLSTLLFVFGMTKWNVILATLVSATIGLKVETWIRTKFF